MEDIIQPFLVILVGGLFAPLLTQLIERFISEPKETNSVSNKPLTDAQKKEKRKKWLKLFSYAVCIQLLLFTIFFICSKLIYFDKNYFDTNERQLIREGIKENRDYVIPKMTIRIYSEVNSGIPLTKTICSEKKINYCSLVTISYEIVALKKFNSEKIFQEYYDANYAENVLKEPGSEFEGPDLNSKKTTCKFKVITSMEKYERKTITTRADFLYNEFPQVREFFDKNIAGQNWDMFYYPNNEGDIIGEVEFQLISRSLKFKTPETNDAILEDANSKQIPINPQLIISNGDCLNFNIITAKVSRLKNNETFGVKWSWEQ